jgi:carbon starvation protein CstA
MIGYGSMLMESSVAVMALVAASGMYAAPRSPRSARRRTSNRRSSPRPG